jgi:hypothetical protein
MVSTDLFILPSSRRLLVKNTSDISTLFYYSGIINSIKWTDLYLILTGYAALSRNGAKKKLRSAATCFSLRSDEARAAARGARVVDEESAKHERASCLLIPARVADFLCKGICSWQLLSG